MNKLILCCIVLLSTSCSTYYNGSYDEYRPFNDHPESNCVVESSDIYLINGVPSLHYICNKVEK